MQTAARAWKPLLVLAPLLALACADPATAPDPLRLDPAVNASLSATLPSISERPFNSKAGSSRDTQGAEGWKTTEYQSSDMLIVNDPAAPRSAASVAEVTFRKGLTGGSEPLRATADFGVQARTVTVDVWNKLSSNWQGPNRGASVLFTLNVSGSKRIAFEAQGANSGRLAPAVSLWSAPDSRDLLLPNVVSTAEVVRGQWQHWRVTVRMNTVGRTDGLIEIELDGVTILRYADVAIVGSSGQDYFNQFDWKPRWGGTGDVVAADMTMRWDHVALRASTDRVASGEPAPAPAPQPAPVASVEATPAVDTSVVGGTLQFSAIARDGSGNAIADAPMTWKSTDSTIASVSASGLATARNVGVALLIASSGAAADTSRLTVTSATTAATTPGDPAPGVPSTGYFVSPSGRSGNSGSASSPWDLATALAGAGGRVQPGDTVWIRGGTYPDGGRLSVGGSAGAPVTFSGYPGETAIIRKQFRSNVNYVVIQHLTFEGPINGATNQVYIYNSHHVVFTRNEIRNGDYHAGLSVDDAHHMTITYNYIHDNGVDTSHDHGIYYKTTTGDGSVIANNLLVRNAARGLSLHDNSGPGVYDVVVAHNTIVGNGSTGILVNDGDRITLVNNIAMNNGDKTGQQQIRVLSGNGNKIWNNLTWHSSASRTGIENRTSSTMSGNRIGNPLFVSNFSDLRVQSGSPAVGLGLSGWAYGPDYAGKVRDSSPGAGAYEQ